MLIKWLMSHLAQTLLSGALYTKLNPLRAQLTYFARFSALSCNSSSAFQNSSRTARACLPIELCQPVKRISDCKIISRSDHQSWRDTHNSNHCRFLHWICRAIFQVGVYFLPYLRDRIVQDTIRAKWILRGTGPAYNRRLEFFPPFLHACTTTREGTVSVHLYTSPFCYAASW